MKTISLIILTFLSIYLFSLTVNADTCDPNSDVPLTAFTIRQDMRAAKNKYEAAPFQCGFSPDQSPRMNFKATSTDNNSFSDRANIVDFACTELTKSGLRYAKISSKILFMVFAGSSLKLSNCQYESTTTPGKDVRGVFEKENSDASSLNLSGNERRLISTALKESHGDTASAAKKLGISEKALVRKMKEYHISQ